MYSMHHLSPHFTYVDKDVECSCISKPVLCMPACNGMFHLIPITVINDFCIVVGKANVNYSLCHIFQKSIISTEIL